jgi:hypothetical protein
MRGRGSRQNLEGWLRRENISSAPTPEAHSPAETATTETTRATAAAVMIVSIGNLSLPGGCVLGGNLSEIWGCVCVPLITHNT